MEKKLVLNFFVLFLVLLLIFMLGLSSISPITGNFLSKIPKADVGGFCLVDSVCESGKCVNNICREIVNEFVEESFEPENLNGRCIILDSKKGEKGQVVCYENLGQNYDCTHVNSVYTYTFNREFFHTFSCNKKIPEFMSITPHINVEYSRSNVVCCRFD